MLLVCLLATQCCFDKCMADKADAVSYVLSGMMYGFPLMLRDFERGMGRWQQTAVAWALWGPCCRGHARRDAVGPLLLAGPRCVGRASICLFPRSKEMLRGRNT